MLTNDNIEDKEDKIDKKMHKFGKFNSTPIVLRLF